MRWSLLLCVGGLAGCLYVNGINHEPEGEIQLGTSLLQYGENGSAVLIASARDPDDDPLTFEWRVKVTDLEQKVHQLKNSKAVFSLGRADNLQELGKGQQPRSIGTGDKLTLAGLPSQGTYEVTLSIKDEQGAERRAVKTFKVDNLDPEVKLLISFDPAYSTKQDGDYAVDKLRYPGHAHYQVRVAEDPLKNPEGDLVCGSKATITFSVDAGFKDKMETWTTKPCQGKEWLDRLRFRLQDDAITAPKTKLTVKAVIDDGHGGSTTATESIELWPNRPPCILATDPDFLALSSSPQAAEVSVLADEPRSFAVRPPSEDVNTGLSYSWWVKDAGGSTFEPILEGAAGGDLSLPAWFRLPGESVELRVMLQETEGAAPTCPAQTERCRPAGEELR